jgi:hypothetical protein
MPRNPQRVDLEIRPLGALMQFAFFFQLKPSDTIATLTVRGETKLASRPPISAIGERL